MFDAFRFFGRSGRLRESIPCVSILESPNEDGHRREYNDLFAALLTEAAIEVRSRPIGVAAVTSRAVALSLMIEDHTVGFFALALTRAIVGRRTVGLLFMPKPSVQPSTFKLRVKRVLLQMCRRSRNVHVLTLAPFEIEPAFAEIASSWIYDPQLWDVSANDAQRETKLSKFIKQAAEGRPVIVSLGLQNQTKGFKKFAGLAPALSDRFLLVAAGRLDPTCATEGEAFSSAGGLLIDRFLTDDEVLSLYRLAAWTWACYAPDYDQSSGVFGRAVQFGVPALLREGSLISRLADAIGHPTLQLPWDETKILATTIAQARPSNSSDRPSIDDMRRVSLKHLFDALGFCVEGNKPWPTSESLSGENHVEHA